MEVSGPHVRGQEFSKLTGSRPTARSRSGRELFSLLANGRPGSHAASVARPRAASPNATRPEYTADDGCNCTATPNTLRPVRNWRTNASSAPVNVKYRINSARLISGNPRSRARSSAENTP